MRAEYIPSILLLTTELAQAKEVRLFGTDIQLGLPERELSDNNTLYKGIIQILDFLDESYLFMRYSFYNIILMYKLSGGIDGTTTI